MKIKFLLGLLAIILGVIGCAIVLSSKHAVVVHPEGLIAKQELKLIITNILLMLTIIVPTYILLFVVVYKYCLKLGKREKYDSDHTVGPIGQLMMWVLPSIVVAIMAVVTYEATHRLDPYKPIESDKKPLTVQVVAIDWKWLFIYPEQGIATLNLFHIPEKTPIHLKLAADNSPMNSFWIPQLSGQIYSMAGMSTQLFLMADGPGKYIGRAVEINGEGYSGMTFSTVSSSQKEFEDWIEEVKKSPLQLTKEDYNKLIKASIIQKIILYSEVEDDLYRQIVDKYMFPTTPLL